MLYCIGGVSGSGKTWLRENHPRLQQLEAWDIADEYARAEQQGQTLDSDEAMHRFFYNVRTRLCGGGSLVLEAYFRPSGEQRRRCTHDARAARMHA